MGRIVRHEEIIHPVSKRKRGFGPDPDQTLLYLRGRRPLGLGRGNRPV